ncbi:MAG: chromosomal replication initiator protein DnaA [Candidatus Levybacteria bacterium GW2011_GWC2_40_7]|nr:MAG: chromosomal replication initiator protein DnaA [Candidatus Levybacteria bacterium GW2011_GWC2_40_7]
MTLDAKLWDKVLAEIQTEVSKAIFLTLFKNTSLVSFENGAVTIAAPSAMIIDLIQKRFYDLIKKSLDAHTGQTTKLLFVPKTITKEAVTEAPLFEASATRTVGHLPRVRADYTFQNMAVSTSNQLAYVSAKTVAEKIGRTYNPLFIYGDTGRGKTHLIQAIGNQFKKQYPGQKVFYLTSEKFVVDYTDSVQAGSANRFKEKYRHYDLLIMDDIQFLSKKERSEEELFHLFNALHDTNKQIIFSSDRAPVAIPDITERLKGRLASGMTIDIGEPDPESRMAIVRKKAALHGVMLSDEVIEYVATSMSGSIRELEGMVNNIICHTQVKGMAPDIAEVRQSLRSFTRPQKNISVKNVVDKVAEYFGIDEERWCAHDK